ncbi:MAG: SCP2 sterol-binding domain-containing protein [Candidatus Helarchaeota archaeon]|nr:SCP2 sterol-binding domain-containing protein [Candidatus Helarchaeota archaeon]
MSKKLKLGSMEWAQEFAKRCNSNEDYLEFAEGLNTSFTIHVPDMDPAIAFNWIANNGKPENLKEGLNPNSEFTMEGTKDIWLQIIKGELNFMDAVQRKQITIKGPLPRLMRYMPATTELIKIIESMSDITDFDV